MGVSPTNSASWLHHARNLFRFAFVAGAGLGLDLLLFAGLTSFAAPSGLANFASSAAGATFVYFVSTKRIFDYHGRMLLRLFAAYLSFQVVLVALASWAIDALTQMNIAPILAKLSTLPATFLANYIFLHGLTRARPS